MKYSYKCPKCQRTTVLVRPIADRNDPVECTCGSEMKRIVANPVSVIYNGNGFTGARKG